jgi:L-aminopeptidase/D-esterase-like protein
MPETTRRALLLAGAAGGLTLAAGRAALGQDKTPPAARPAPDASLGPKVLEFDFPGLLVGSAMYAEGPTGCTVFRFAERPLVVADVRGGAPGTLFTDRVREQYGYLDGVAFAGGSTLGFEAVCGATERTFEARGSKTSWRDVPLVSGAVIYDFAARANAVFPDRALGRAAFDAAKAGRFALGGRGAGAGATCGKAVPGTVRETAGQGGAFHAAGSVRVAVFTVVNSLGAILDRRGAVVRGNKDVKTGRRLPPPDLRKATDAAPGAADDEGNTTLTLLVVNVALDAYALRQVAREVHASMARAIQPFHGLGDGDVLFAATTAALPAAAASAERLASIASDCAWDAVLSSFAGRD